MGEDISSGAKIGIILIILCSLIAIVFALLTMMKNITNTGSSQLQNGLDQMLASQFQDYDQKIITGTQVASAMSIFDGQPVAFVVRTTASNKASKAYCYGALITGTTEANAEQDSDGKVYTVATSTITGAKEAGAGFYTLSLDVSKGSYAYNLNIKPTKTSGTSTYIRSSAKFMSELIHDSTGDTIGIVFTQQ